MSGDKDRKPATQAGHNDDPTLVDPLPPSSGDAASADYMNDPVVRRVVALYGERVEEDDDADRTRDDEALRLLIGFGGRKRGKERGLPPPRITASTDGDATAKYAGETKPLPGAAIKTPARKVMVGASGAFADAPTVMGVRTLRQRRARAVLAGAGVALAVLCLGLFAWRTFGRDVPPLRTAAPTPSAPIVDVGSNRPSAPGAPPLAPTQVGNAASGASVASMQPAASASSVPVRPGRSGPTRRDQDAVLHTERVGAAASSSPAVRPSGAASSAKAGSGSTSSSAIDSSTQPFVQEP